MHRHTTEEKTMAKPKIYHVKHEDCTPEEPSEGFYISRGDESPDGPYRSLERAEEVADEDEK